MTQDKDAQLTRSTGAPSGFPSGKHALITSTVVVLGLAAFFILQVKKPDTQPSKPSKSSFDATKEPFQTAAGIASLDTTAKRQLTQLTNTRLDPSRDGWETEVVAELAKSQLLKIAGQAGKASANSKLENTVAEDIRFSNLRPADLVEMTGRLAGAEQIKILRPESEDPAPLDVQGRADFFAALSELVAPFLDSRDEESRDQPHNQHFHFKVIRVALEGDTARTVAYYEAEGANPEGGGAVQQRATWHCTWSREDDQSLLLTSLQATDFEEAVSKGPWLVDSTSAILANNSSYNQQLRYGLNHWLARLERIRGMHVFTRNGLSLGDVNGDGMEDVYVCQPGGLPNRLFVQQPDGTAVDRSREAGVDWLDQTTSALFLDLDNDGDQDLVAATVAGLLVMENDGTGKFQLRKTLATNDTDTQSFSAADYDNDGDLDLYICLEFARQLTLQYQSDGAFVYHDANDGAANVLYRNDTKDGNWQFTDVTEQVGLDQDNRRHSLACAWEDFDNDGDQDLYVANDYGKNCLYENIEGHFKNIADVANAVDSASGMSVSWGDYDHDGFMDLYVANMFSSAGNRITTQEQFRSGGNKDLRKVYSRFAKGNTLLRNTGEGDFEDIGKLAGVEMGRWAWSSVFADLNNDTWEDLLVANGYITTEDSGDL